MTSWFRAWSAWVLVCGACAASHEVNPSGPPDAETDERDAGFTPDTPDAATECPDGFVRDDLGCARWVPASGLACTGTSTRLHDGRVLVVGECTDSIGPALGAFLYDPLREEWSTARAPAVPRTSHSATRLSDGRVLIAGGIDAADELVRSAETFDPRSEVWTGASALGIARAGHAAVSIPGGVLVTGGTHRLNRLSPTPDLVTETVELFDGARWRFAASMNEARVEHAAIALLDGRVLVAGNTRPFLPKSIELYDPATDRWELTERFRPGGGHGTATLLDDGAVLFVGFDSTPLLYRPSASGLVPTGPSSVPDGPSGHLASRVGERVLVVGGQGYAVESPAELYDPITRQWTRTVSPRGWYNIAPALGAFPAAELGDESVLVAGAERYERMP